MKSPTALYERLHASLSKEMKLAALAQQKASIDRLLFDQFNRHAKLAIFKQTAKRLTVHKIDCRRAVSRCFATSIRREGTWGDYQSLVCTADHGSSKISHNTGSNRTFPTLALKQYVK